jgi:hypothetical protein
MTGQQAMTCSYCGPGVRTYRDPADPPGALYCARCGRPTLETLELLTARDREAAGR